MRAIRAWRKFRQIKMRIEIEFAHGVRLDILTPGDPSGAGTLARFLARFGEGLQQVECEVRDAGRATEILRSECSWSLSTLKLVPEPGIHV